MTDDLKLLIGGLTNRMVTVENRLATALTCTNDLRRQVRDLKAKVALQSTRITDNTGRCENLEAKEQFIDKRLADDMRAAGFTVHDKQHNVEPLGDMTNTIEDEDVQFVAACRGKPHPEPAWWNDERVNPIIRWFYSHHNATWNDIPRVNQEQLLALADAIIEDRDCEFKLIRRQVRRDTCHRAADVVQEMRSDISKGDPGWNQLLWAEESIRRLADEGADDE